MSIKRRDFLKTTAAIGAGTLFIPSFMRCSANNKVNIAVIGVGGRGHSNWPSFLNKENPELSENIVAFCDVDDVKAADGYKLLPNVPRFKDFRKMFDKMHRDIDAVIITTPDHMHFPATMAAMELGIHVYVEKPLAHSVWELRTLKKAAAYYPNVVTQMGNQGHATDGIRRVKEWVDAGIIGDVEEIVAWFNGPTFKKKGYFLKPETWPPAKQAIPETLDWDSWIGPREMRDFNECYLPRFWRGWFDFGNAELGDWACHTLDAPYWALELGSPERVVVEQNDISPMPSQFTPDRSKLRFEFPPRGSKPPVKLTWHDGGIRPEIRPEWAHEKMGGSGMIMVGSKNSIITGGRPNDSRIIMPPEEWKEFQKTLPEPTIRRIPKQSPHHEWLDAIKGTGPKPGSSFEYSAGMTEMAVVGVLAQRANETIEFDAEKMEIKGRPDLNKYIKEDYREGWRYGENLWK